MLVALSDTERVSNDSLGGYRLVRKLGEARRAEVFLGHSLHTEGQLAALKMFRAGVPDISIVAEIDALSRSAGEHCMELVDVTTAPDGAQALILERLPGGSLARLVGDRRSLRLGEAITILAPLVTAVERLHRAGVVHGAVQASSVLFDASGSPILSCFGSSSLIGAGLPPARLEAEPGVAIDNAGLATIARSVLGAVDDPAARAVHDWLSASEESTGLWAELVDRLFDAGPAESIDFTPSVSMLAVAVPGRLVTLPPVAPARVGLPWVGLPRVGPLQGTGPSDATRYEARWNVGRLALAVPEWADNILSAGAVGRLRSGLAVVRPRVWIAAGVSVAALLAALVFVPLGTSDAAEPAAHPTAGNQPAPLPTASGARDSGRRVIEADDPVAALVALVAARDRCIRDLSVLCLAAVAQQGSSALAADEDLIRALQDGAEIPQQFQLNATQVTIDERLGDSVILSLDGVSDSEPASVLLMKGEAGWRIRDYLDGFPASGLTSGSDS